MSDFNDSSRTYVRTDDIKAAVRGREQSVLDALHIRWSNGSKSKITCPYPGHGGNDDWRWDQDEGKAFCTCQNPHSIVDVAGLCKGLGYDDAKLWVAETIGRADLIKTKRVNGHRFTAQVAASLLNPPPDLRDDDLVLAYLAYRLGAAPADVPVPSTPTAGWRSLAYFDGGKVGEFPCAVFGTVDVDGKRHAHRIYVAPGGAGKANLPPRENGEDRDVKKSATKLDGDSSTSGRSVFWGDPATAPWIIVAEGIETAAAVAHVFRAEIEAGELAVAAAIYADGIKAFKPYPATTRITVAADRDEESDGDRAASKTGEKAARTFGLRNQGSSVEIFIALPGMAGEGVDFLDVLNRDGAKMVRAEIDGAERFVPTEDETTKAEQSRAEETVRWPDRYRLTPAGLVWSKSGKDDKEPEDWRLTGPFQVLGEARDQNGNGRAIAIAWADNDGRPHRGFVAKADLLGDGYDAFRPLMSGGLWLATGNSQIRSLKIAFRDIDCRARLKLVQKCGWDGNSFVLPTQTLGRTVGESVIFDGRSDVARYAEAGSLADWIERVARPAAGNSRIVFAISLAFAGPLADLLSEEGGGIHFWGPSSIGKTTIIIAAGSVWGGGARTGFAQTWRSTDNGLEAVARSHSGTLLALDEIAELDSRVAGSVAYMLLNGQGKGRASRDADLRPRAEWRVMVLSSGELTLGDKIAEGGRRAKAGQLIRIVDVPADAGKGLGLFEDTKGQPPGDFAKNLKAAALQRYGVAGPMFVEGLAGNLDDVHDHARQRIIDISHDLLADVAEPDGQIIRAAGKFALIAVAGELARGVLGLPWAEGDAIAAAQTCFRSWLDTRGGKGPGELVAAVNALKETIERHGESRFRDLDHGQDLKLPTPAPAQSAIRDLLGYRFVHAKSEPLALDGTVIWAFTSTGWKEALRGTSDPQSIAKMLNERGVMLTTESDKFCRLVKKVAGRTVALYAVKQSALDAEG